VATLLAGENAKSLRARGSLSLDNQRVNIGQPVNSGEGRSTLVKHVIFTLFLAGGSSAETLNGLARKR